MYAGKSEQQWTPVVFKKRTADDIPKQAVIKPRATKNSNAVVDVNILKLTEDTEVLKHETVSKSLSQQIVSARVAAKLTQAQLAQKINEVPKVVQEYENGKAIPNNHILQKMSKVLGCRFSKNTK
jgi:putative transcription factor